MNALAVCSTTTIGKRLENSRSIYCTIRDFGSSYSYTIDHFRYFSTYDTPGHDELLVGLAQLTETVSNFLYDYDDCADESKIDTYGFGDLSSRPT